MGKKNYQLKQTYYLYQHGEEFHTKKLWRQHMDLVKPTYLVLAAMVQFTKEHLGGMNIAIKVFNQQLEGAFLSFDAECEVIRNIRHRNLLRIISACSNIDFKALVLEFMPNGSLEKRLYSHNYCLQIMQRLNIVIDVALALEYLHYGYSTAVLHCDLKLSNVLLDEEMVAHLSDFGIAKLLGDGESMTQTQTLATIGYIAPEYGREGIMSRNDDVYSYGIMLMETFSRKKPTEEIFAGEMSLKDWVSDSVLYVTN